MDNANILSMLKNITLTDWEGEGSSPKPSAYDPCDSASETCSIASSSQPSMMLEDSSYELSEISSQECERSEQSSNLLGNDLSETETQVIFYLPPKMQSECETSNEFKYNNAEQSMLKKSSYKLSKESKKYTLVNTIFEKNTIELSKRRVSASKGSKTAGLRSPGPQQCSFCGKYEKPVKRHIRCELCGVAAYCRIKCQARDRQRHNTHDCLIRESTAWFSIKRNHK